jgi:hypothetical protein
MLNEDKVWTKYNLNEKGNPLPQYEKYTSYQTLSQSTVGYLKVFDENIQFNTGVVDEQNRTLEYITFTVLIDSITSSYYREKSLFDVGIRIKDTSNLSISASITPINYILGKQFYSIIAYKKITDTPTITFQVQVYLYLPVSLTKIRFSFLDFYTEGQSNRYSISGYADKYNSIKDRLDFYLGNNITQNNIVSSIDGSFTLYDTRNKPYVDYTVTGGTSVTIYSETKLLLMGASSAHSLDTITSINIIDKGQMLTLKFYNSNSTIVSTGNIDTGEQYKIVLRGLTNVTPTTKGQTITLQFDGIKWIEIARNF